MIDLMCWAASRRCLPVTSWNKIGYQDMKAPNRMTTVPASPDEMRLTNDCAIAIDSAACQFMAGQVQ
jgi:hypothetical protein